jgi:hypothetical protein
MKYQGISQIEAVCDAIEAGQEPFDSFDHIVLDTASNIALLDLDVVVKVRAKKDPGKNEDFPTQPDYGHNTERMRRVINRLLTLPVHITMTAHAREDRDERTGVIYVRPDFTPKLRKSIGRMCHLIGYMTATGGVDDASDAEYVRKIQVHPTRQIEAKSRIKGLPPVVDNINLNKIMKDWLRTGQGELAPNMDSDISKDVVVGELVESSPELIEEKPATKPASNLSI